MPYRIAALFGALFAEERPGVPMRGFVTAPPDREPRRLSSCPTVLEDVGGADGARWRGVLDTLLIGCEEGLVAGREAGLADCARVNLEAANAASAAAFARARGPSGTSAVASQVAAVDDDVAATIEKVPVFERVSEEDTD